eukprot:2864617-Pyramimonas_sp.AAC.1
MRGHANSAVREADGDRSLVSVARSAGPGSKPTTVPSTSCTAKGCWIAVASRARMPQRKSTTGGRRLVFWMPGIR